MPSHLTDSSSSTALYNYSLTVPGPGSGSSAARMDPELAAVTLVLAGYARVSAVSLVDCVRGLEKQMLAVESALKVMDRIGDSLSDRNADRDARARQE
jgi:hypothetical protein